MLKKNLNKYIIHISLIIVFLIPIFHINNINIYKFGGDSTRLYFFFTELWLKNYSINLFSFGFLDNPMHGSAEMNFSLFIMFLINKLHPNLVLITEYSIIHVLSFLSFLLFSKDLITKKLYENINVKIIILTLSFLYSNCWLVAYAIYNLGGIWIYSFFATPLLIIFFFRSIIENKFKYVVYFTLFSYFFSTVYSYKIFNINFLIFILMSVFYLSIIRIKKIKINYKLIILYLILIILLNTHYFYQIYLEFNEKNIEGLFDPETVENRKNYFTNLVNNENPFFSLLLLPDLNLMFSGNDPFFLRYNFFFKILSLVNLFFPCLVIYNILKFSNFKNNNFLRISLICFLIFFIFMNLSFNLISLYIFNFFFENLTIMNMYRSYSVKFSYAYSIAFLVLIFISIIYAGIYKSKKFQIALVLITIFNSYPILTGGYNNLKPYLVSKDIKSYNGLGPDFFELVDFLKANLHKNYGALVSLPFSKEYSLHLNSDEYAYIAPSPYPLFLNTFDVTGNSKIGKELNKNFTSDKILNFTSILKKNNIKYLILHKNINDQIFGNFLTNNENNKNEKLLNIINDINLNKIFENKSYAVFLQGLNVNNCINFEFLQSSKIILKTNNCKTIVELKKSLINFNKNNFFSKEFKVYLTQDRYDKDINFFNYFSNLNFLNKGINFDDFYKKTELDLKTNLLITSDNQIIFEAILIFSFFSPIFFLFFFKKIIKFQK